MDRQLILDNVRNLILGTNTGLYPDDVTEAASMTYDLGMDSFYLESLIAKLKEEVADIEFTPWYIRAARRGHDTVGSMVDYIEERLSQLESSQANRTPATSDIGQRPALDAEAA
jgi:acyl carrier protein